MIEDLVNPQTMVYYCLVDIYGKTKVDEIIDLVLMVNDPGAIGVMLASNEDGPGVDIVEKYFLFKLNQ